MQSSWTLSEATTKKGRCSEASGNGPLILGDTLAKELKTYAQVIEILERVVGWRLMLPRQLSDALNTSNNRSLSLAEVLQGGSFPREGIPYFYGAVNGYLHSWLACRQTIAFDKNKVNCGGSLRRHLKRVDASALYLFGCKIRHVKTYISIGNRRSCWCFSDRM